MISGLLLSLFLSLLCEHVAGNTLAKRHGWSSGYVMDGSYYEGVDAWQQNNGHVVESIMRPRQSASIEYKYALVLHRRADSARGWYFGIFPRYRYRHDFCLSWPQYACETYW